MEKHEVFNFGGNPTAISAFGELLVGCVSVPTEWLMFLPSVVLQWIKKAWSQVIGWGPCFVSGDRKDVWSQKKRANSGYKGWVGTKKLDACAKQTLYQIWIKFCRTVASVLWCCWMDNRKGTSPVKNWVVGVSMVICLGRRADLHMAQLMPLPLTVSCSRKSRLVLPFWYRITQVIQDKIQTAVKRLL